MNTVYLYTLWHRVPDLIENPVMLQEGVNFEYDVDDEMVIHVTDPTTGDTNPLQRYVIDPNNRSGVRYEAIKCVDNLDIVKSICEGSDGEYVYTYAQAWFGMSD